MSVTPITRPFRFGVQMRGQPDAAAWVADAARFEGLGFSVVTMSDHPAHGLAAVPLLAATAGATSTIRLGTFVLANDFRHPIVLAQETATLDQLAAGRFELGIGAGWDRAEYEAIGIPLDRPAVRIDRLRDATLLLKRLLAGETVAGPGAHYQTTGFTLPVAPIQRPHPPILIGGGGRRVLELAATEADIVGLAPRSLPDGTLEPASISEAATVRKIDWIRAAAGDRWPELELNIYVYAVEVTEDRVGASERLSEAFALPAADVLASPHTLIGSEDEIVAQLQERRARWGISYITVSSPLAEAIAPIAARLAGT